MSTPLQFKAFDFEVKKTDNGGMTGEGYASVFFNIDAAGEIVDDRAFTSSIQQFMKDGFVGGINHNWDEPIGSPTKAQPDGKGLYVGWKLSDTQHGRDCAQLLQDGVIKKLSIGYKVKGATWLETEDDVMAYWSGKGYTPNAQDVARSKYGVRVLNDIHLYEFSPVTVPANDQADIARVKAAKLAAILADEEQNDDVVTDVTDVRTFEKYLRDEGLSRTSAKRIISISRKVFQRDVGGTAVPDEPSTPDPVETPEETKEASETVPAETVVASDAVVISPELEAKTKQMMDDVFLRYQQLKRKSPLSA